MGVRVPGGEPKPGSGMQSEASSATGLALTCLLTLCLLCVTTMFPQRPSANKLKTAP